MNNIEPQSQKFSSSINYYLQNSYIEFKRRKGQYCLAFLSCTIVVLVTSVAQTVIDNAPIIFLQLAEGGSGEIDIQIKPPKDLNILDKYPQTMFLNQSKVSEVITKNEYQDLATPRFTSQIILTAPNSESKCSDMYSDNYLIEKYKLYNPIFNEQCRCSKLQLIAIDTNKESLLKVGRNYKRTELLPNEALMHKKRALNYGVQQGDTVILEISLGPLAEIVVQNYNFGKPAINQIQLLNVKNMTVRVPYKLNDIFDDISGKVADKEAEAIFIVENKHFLKYALQFINNTKSHLNEFIDYFQNVQLNQYSSEIIINLPEPRIKSYLNPNYDEIQAEITTFAQDLCEILGTFAFKMHLPVLQELQPLRFGSLFLGITLNIIILLLFFLSVLLIYSLLMVSVDTKTFEMGVIRVLGSNTTGVVQLIIIQALTFAIPAIIVGLGLTIPCLTITSIFFENEIGLPLSTTPSKSGLIWSIILGLLIPLISALYPIQEALNQTLQQQLDTIHSKTSAILFQIENDAHQIPWIKIWFGILSITFGISVYYLLPLALLSLNLSLLLGIFLWILIGFIFGLVLLSLNVQHLTERFITFICLFYQDKVLRSLVVKNLIAHRIRNRKTSIMYALSLGFVIFITVSYNMELESSSYEARQKQGVYMSATIYDYNYFEYRKLEKFINEELSEYIEQYAWITEDLANYMASRGYKSIFMTNIGQLYNFNPLIVGVSSNFLDLTFPEYLDIEKSNQNSGLNIVEQLYTVDGFQKVIIGEYYRSKFQLELENRNSFLIKIQNGINTKQFEFQVGAVLNAAPTLTFSSIPGVDPQNLIISLPTYLRLTGLNETNQGVYSLPMKKLLIKFKNYDDNSASKVYSGLTRFSELNGNQLTIWDFKDFAMNLKKSASTVSIIFIVVTIIVMFLCLFSLISSMSANIMEQTKEIAVLRAVGFTKARMILLYIDEAFVLVFSSSLLGILIGTFVGWTMTIQRILFTQLPIRFVFPTQNLIVVLIVSLVCAFGSSYFPARRIMNNQISQIFRVSD